MFPEKSITNIRIDKFTKYAKLQCQRYSICSAEDRSPSTNIMQTRRNHKTAIFSSNYGIMVINQNAKQ